MEESFATPLIPEQRKAAEWAARRADDAAHGRLDRIEAALRDIASILGEDPQKLPREFLERRYLGARARAERMLKGA